MHGQLSADLSLTLTWMWLVYLGIGLLVFVAYRLWRKTHPSAKVDTSTYARKLMQRLRQGKAHADNKQRR